MSDLTPTERMIVEALAELNAARADWTHSPNTDTELTVEYAELRLNRLLDRMNSTSKRTDDMPSGAAMSG